MYLPGISSFMARTRLVVLFLIIAPTGHESHHSYRVTSNWSHKRHKKHKRRSRSVILPFVLFVPFVANLLPTRPGYGLSNSPEARDYMSITESFIPQRRKRIHFRSAKCGYPTSQQRHY